MPFRRYFLLCFLVTGVCAAQDKLTKDTSTFSGTVRDSVTRQPLSKASMVLKPAGAGPAYTGSTDGAGEFRFETLVPANYHLEVRRRGYTNGHTASIHAGQTTAVLAFAAGQDITKAVIELAPDAIVSGRVVDAEGAPVAGAVVWALGEKWTNGIHGYELSESTMAVDSGQYRLKVPAGTYYLMARPHSGSLLPSNFAADPGRPEMRSVAVFYPGSTELTSAALIEIAPGQQMGGMDFKLPTLATFHVRGVVKSYTARSAQRLPSLALGKRNEPFARRPEAGTWIEKDGAFDIPGVIPGSYWLELEPFVNSPAGRIPVEVADRNVDRVVLQSMPMLTLKGTARFRDPEVAQPLPSLTFHIEMLDWFYFHSSLDFAPKADASFTTSLLMCGQYAITLKPDRDAYIQSISYQGRELPAGKIDLTNGAAGDVDIVVATGTGQIEGSLHWPETPPGAEIHAVLVSATGQTGNTGARLAEIDANGHFQFRFVPPGRYLVFATEFPADGIWQNLNFVQTMAAKGVVAEIEKNGAAHVEVPILPADEVRRAIAQVRQ